MKKIIVLLALLISANVTSQAQRVSFGDGNEGGANIVKLNLWALGYRGISLQYERFLKPKVSVALGGRYTLSGNVPGTLITAADGIVPKFQAWAVAPELRYYFGKGNGKGFYLGLMGRVDDNTIKIPFTTDLTSTAFSTELNGKISGFGGGLQLGSQWVFAEKFVLDWWIAGPQVLASKANLEATSNDFGLTPTDIAEINAELVSLGDLRVFKIDKVEVTNQRMAISTTGNLIRPGARVGLCVGYKF